MNLTKLFKAQKALDERIIEEKGLQGQDKSIDKLIALFTELGECANEWRGFKFWSEDQEPRILKSVPDMDHFEKTREARFIRSNPLLEEYVDGLHFYLSLGIEMGLEDRMDEPPLKMESAKKTFWATFVALGAAFMNSEASAIKPQFITAFMLFRGLGEQLGFTDEQIEAAYFAKNATNHKRQEEHY